MNKKIEELLPIGSVVKLRNAEKKVMIQGIMLNVDEKYFDYAGVLYPEGFMGEGSQLAFQAEDIETLLFCGFIDAERQIFVMEQVKARMKEEKKE